MEQRVLYGIIALIVLLGAGLFVNSFATSDSMTLNALKPSQGLVQYTFAMSSNLNAQQNAIALTVDGVQYTYSQMPSYNEFNPNTYHTYSFAATIPSKVPGKQYTLKYVTRCGVNSTDLGSFDATGPCTVVAKYS